jgi:hypothetical protein
MAARRRQIRRKREYRDRLTAPDGFEGGEIGPAMMKTKRSILDEVRSKFPRSQKSEFS